jgi:hypothetical protein
VADFVGLTRKAIFSHDNPIPSVGDYYTGFFLSHVSYVCIRLRGSTGVLGLKWWRSLILGFAFSQLPRILYCSITQIPHPLSDFASVTWHYFLIWSSFNIFPFDLVTRLFSFPICALALYFAGAMAQGDLIAYLVLIRHFGIFPDFFARLFVIAFSFAAPIAIDAMDSEFATRNSFPKRVVMLYPWSYAKRVIVEAVIALAFAERRRLRWISAAISLAFRVLDFICCAHPHDFWDCLLPVSFCRKLGGLRKEKAE